ncbi:MAG TPA: PQQ-binding-like beta-propeller repeat protein [Gemmataceae bacterium]|nr:PQQ-binding-like beta-propeller repeat protein [Gemmataceae bacterium]
MFSPNGRLVAASSGPVIEIWDVATGGLIKEFVGHENIVNSLAISPDGKTLASASFDRTVRFWDIATGKERHRGIGHTEGIAFLTYSPDGTTVASGGYDKTVRIWDSANGKQSHLFEGSAAMILGLAFSPDAQTVASCGGEPIIRLWSLKTGKAEGTLEGSPANVRSVAFTPDGKAISSSCCDGSMRLWDLATKKEQRTFSGHRDDVFVIATADEGETLFTGSHDGTIAKWNTSNGKKLTDWTAHTGGVVCFHLNADGKTLVSGGYDKTIRLWDVATARERLVFNSQENVHQSSANSVAISSDEGLLASADSHGKIIVRDARSGAVFRILADQISSFPAPERPGLSDLAFVPGGTELIAVGLDGIVRRWDASTGKFLRVSQSVGTPLYSLAIAPDGKSVAVAGKDGRIVVFDSTLTKADLLIGHKEPVVSLAFNQTGDRLVSASHDRTARLWDLKTKKELTQFAGHARALTTAIFSPDGKTVATAAFDKTVRFWDVATGKEDESKRWKLPRPGPLTFSSDGKRLAAAADDEIRIRNLETAKEELVFDPRADRITSLAFTPNGKALASATIDGSVTLWNTSNAKPLDAPHPPTEQLMKAWWAELAGNDMLVVHRSIWGLTAHPDATVSYIGERTEPAKGPGRERIQRWLLDLDNDRFAVREVATKELQKIGPSIVPTLKKHLAAKLSPEARERVEKLIDKLLVEPLPAAEIRASRLVEVLERIGTADARAVLERLETGDPDATLTVQAKAALARLSATR